MVAFGVGPDGAHQVMNRGEEPARVLVVGEMNAPEVSVYPDTDKILADPAPGGAGDPDDIFETFRRKDAADYWEGEEPPK